MTRALRVARAGFFTTVQDRGRFDHRHEGVASCGAFDSLAFDIANALAGNPGNAAALEIAFGNAEFTFLNDGRFAIAGADMRARLDGRAIAPWSGAFATAGQTLRFETAATGMRSVLALEGGFDVPPILGSRSTDVRTGFGGFHGRALQRGDEIPVGAAPSPARKDAIRVKPPAVNRAEPIAVLVCAEFARFEAESQRQFFEAAWTVSPQSSRVAYRLDGPSLRFDGDAGAVLSHTVFPGVIQVPPAGNPMVLLVDTGTTGGYPKAGVVCSADLWKFADLPPGAAMRFRRVTLEEAEEARDELARYVAEMTQVIAGRLRS